MMSLDPKIPARIFKNYGGITEVHSPGYFKQIQVTIPNTMKTRKSCECSIPRYTDVL